MESHSQSPARAGTAPTARFDAVIEPSSILTVEERLALRRTLVLANGKGGVGKTSVATNIAGILGDAGYKVLVVDLDPQCDTGINFGYAAAGLSDKGEALYRAVNLGEELGVVKNIRKGVDVVPSGLERTSELAEIIAGSARRGNDRRGAVAKAVAKIAPQYDVVLIDTPPFFPVLLDEALLAGHWIIIPADGEEKTIQGVSRLASMVQRIRPDNQEIRPLGVVLFGMVSGATQQEKEARDELHKMLGPDIHIFDQTIRFVRAADTKATRRGQLAHELAVDAASAEPFWKRLRGESSEPVIPRSATSLGEDYMALTKEIVNLLQEQEDALSAGEDVK